MLKAAAVVPLLVASIALAGPASAGRERAEMKRNPVLGLLAGKLTAAPKKRYSVRMADAAECSGQTQPVIACECLSTDSSGVCIQESCETVCDGNQP